METTSYNIKGEKAGKLELPENLFGLPWNADLVHQVVTSMQGNARNRTAHTKTRGEVRGGGKKPWQQKGTGRARHGSSRSPIWKGGGVTHGPRNDKSYTTKINQKMRQKALLTALSQKARDGEIILLESLVIEKPKTRDARDILTGLSKTFPKLSKGKNAALVALPNAHTNTHKSFQNIGNIELSEVRNLNPLSVLSSAYLIIADPKASFETLTKQHVVQKYYGTYKTQQPHTHESTRHRNRLVPFSTWRIRVCCVPPRK